MIECPQCGVPCAPFDLGAWRASSSFACPHDDSVYLAHVVSHPADPHLGRSAEANSNAIAQMAQKRKPR